MLNLHSTGFLVLMMYIWKGAIVDSQPLNNPDLCTSVHLCFHSCQSLSPFTYFFYLSIMLALNIGSRKLWLGLYIFFSVVLETVQQHHCISASSEFKHLYFLKWRISANHSMKSLYQPKKLCRRILHFFKQALTQSRTNKALAQFHAVTFTAHYAHFHLRTLKKSCVDVI